MSDDDHSQEDNDELLKILESRSRVAAGTDFVNRHLLTNPDDVGTASKEEDSEERVVSSNATHDQEGTSNPIAPTNTNIFTARSQTHRQLQFLAPRAKSGNDNNSISQRAMTAPAGDLGIPGAHAVRGMACSSDSEEEEEEEEDGKNGPLGSMGSLSEALVDVPVVASLVSDEVVVATAVSENMDVHRAERKMIQMLLCVGNPEESSLDEAAVSKLLKDFPHLFREKYELEIAESEAKSNRYLYPLSLVCRLKPSIKFLKAIVGAHPKAIQEGDECDFLPIHYAARYGADIRVVKFLLDAYPESANASDYKGNLPLHLSCQHDKSWKVTEFLISCYPETIKHARNDGALPLHVAIQTEDSNSTVLKLLERFPEAASIATNDGSLPLHLICLRKDDHKNTSLVRELLNLYPEAAATRTSEPYRSLPLHIASHHRSPGSIIAMLLEAYPDGAKQKDVSGVYPLYYVAGNHNDRTILKVFRAFPEAAREPDFYGGLPLHGALKNKRSEEVIMVLLSSYPEGAKFTDQRGRLPLHIALNKKVAYSAECIKHMISLNEEAASAKTDEGQYPLHLACKNHDDKDMTLKLIQLFPEALKIRGERSRLPLHMLACNTSRGNDLETAREMLKLYPEAVRIKDKKGKLPVALAQEANASAEMLALLSPYNR